MAYPSNEKGKRKFSGGSAGVNGGHYWADNLMRGDDNVSQLPVNNQILGNFSLGNMHECVQNMNIQGLSFANNLLNNMFHNQPPPSLMQLSNVHMANRNGINDVGIGDGFFNRFNNYQGKQRRLKTRNDNKPKTAPKQYAGNFRNQNTLNRAKKTMGKNNKNDSTAGGEKTVSKVSAYAKVPNYMFFCHLCKKHMWSAQSFENHVNGRIHLKICKEIEENYRLQANIIRHEAKLNEQLKLIEFGRLKLMGKYKQRMLEHCTMCDHKIKGRIGQHRRSAAHLHLKRFLHPECSICNMEFATRTDFDKHLLSPEHLIKAAELNIKPGKQTDSRLNICTLDDELKSLRSTGKRQANITGTQVNGEDKKKNINLDEDDDDDWTDVKKEVDEDDEGNGMKKECDKESKGAEESNAITEEDVPFSVDRDDVIIDFVGTEEIPEEIGNRLPKYNSTRAVGISQVKYLNCYECALCGRFLDNKKTAEVHTRTITHYRNFIKLLNKKSSERNIAQKRAAAAATAEGSERKKLKLETAKAAEVKGIKNEIVDNEDDIIGNSAVNPYEENVLDAKVKVESVE